MVLGIDPTVDMAFKLLLGNPNFPEVTVHFLNSVLCQRAGDARIRSVQFLNPIADAAYRDDKLFILDVLAEDDLGRLINIEMQTTLPAGIKQRLVYYLSTNYSSQLAEGENYSKLRPTILICVLNVSMFPRVDELHHDFRMRSQRQIVLYEGFQIHLLELSKYLPMGDNWPLDTPLERWLFFLKNAHHLSREDLAKQLPDREFQTAAGVLEMISHTPHERALYEARLKAQRDESSKIEEAHDKGFQEGEKSGLEKGEQIGLQKGRDLGQFIGKIRLLQDLLSIPQTPVEGLSNHSLAELAQLEAALQLQLRNRNGTGA